MNLRYFFIFFFVLMIASNIHAEDFSQSLDFDVFKAKYMDVDVSIEFPIYIEKYSANSSFTLTTPIFSNTKYQNVTLEAYYLQDGQKVFAEIITDEYDNRFAVFNIEKIDRFEYVFYIDARIISENKLVFPEEEFSLLKDIEDYQDYKKATRYINSDKSEIISVSNFLKKSDNALKEITNIIDWTYKYIEYDSSYSEKVVEAVNVLSERKGVCSEFAILAASILRERGIPTRYVTGYANSTIEWQAHAWLEVYVPGLDWIQVDPTFGEVGLVDASHLLVSRSFDPSEIKDRITAYGDVSLVFGDKKTVFKINDHKGFNETGYGNSIDVDLDYPDQIREDNAFYITADIKNKTSRPITMLFILSIHDDFTLLSPESEKNIFYLEPFVEKKVRFYLLSDVEVPLNYKKTYRFYLKSQIDDYEGNLEVYKDKGFYQEAFFLTEPLFYFEKGSLNLELDVFNYTKSLKNINFDFNNNGVISSSEVNLVSNSVYNLLESFNVDKNSNFSLNISGDYNAFYEFYIFEDNIVVENSPPIVDSNLDQGILNDYDENIWDRGFDNDFKEKDDRNSLVGIFIIVGFILLTVIVFIFRNNKEDN